MTKSRDRIHRRRHGVLIELGDAEGLRDAAADVLDDVVVTDVDGAVRAVSKRPEVSFAIIDDCEGGGAAALIETIDELEPSLPIIVVGPTHYGLARATLEAPVDAAALGHALGELTEIRSYEDELVSAFADSVTQTLEEGFVRDVSVDGAYHKANRRHLAKVGAMLHFEGGSFSGWISIAGATPVLRSIYESMFDGALPEYRELEDLTGEIANHVVASLRRWLPDSTPRIVSVPEILRGADGQVRKTRARHSFVLELSTASGPLFAQLHFTADTPVVVARDPQVTQAFQML